MGTTITSRQPFSGKNSLYVIAEEVTVTTGAPSYGKNRTELITPGGSTPAGPFTWKSLGYATGGQTTETRTIEEIGAISRRNIQQLVETRFECSGAVDLEYQNARPLYLAIASHSGLGTYTIAPGIAHDTTAPLYAGLQRHIIYEPEVVGGATEGTWTENAIPDPISFNFVDGYTAVGATSNTVTSPKVIRKYLGCKVDTLTMNFTRDGAIKLNMAWKGSQVYASQATTAANLRMSDFLMYEEVFPPVFGKVYLQAWTLPTSTLPTWTAALDTSLAAVGNLIGDVPQASLTISNTLEPLFVISDITARAMPAQARKYEGRVSLAFVSEEMHVKFLGEFNNTYAADPTGGAAVGVGTWTYPWYAADRQKYYAMKLFYDNSSLGYAATTSASYRKIEITLLGVKFKSSSTPRNVNGIIYQDFDFTALMLAPYYATDKVGGIVAIDGMTSTDFHSTITGIA